MAIADDHRRQADVLTRLASSTRKPETAAPLMRAGEHATLADRGPAAADSTPRRTRPPQWAASLAFSPCSDYMESSHTYLGAPNGTASNQAARTRRARTTD
jgi:hypothetical protein